MIETTKPSVCIIGGGNAAHALAALLPHRGYARTTMYCPFQDEADRMNAGLSEQGGSMRGDFASHNDPGGLVEGKPLLVSKDAKDVVPDSDVLVMPLPSFAYPSTLEGIKPYLREGQTICVTPGQGGFDWFAREILGPELLEKITVVGVMPMPFNCRIEEFGKRVHVQELKKKYSIGVVPRSAFDKSRDLIADMFNSGTVLPAGEGTFLECSMFPINAVIHPSRLITLLGGLKEGETLPENPYFYEDFTPEGAKCMDDVNEELIAIGKSLTAKGIPVDVPHIFDWLACYVYGEPKDSDLCRFFRTNDAYKGFRCPLIPAEANGSNGGKGGGFVPNYKNRYFTEDIPLGLCLYKGLADIADVSTPKMDEIVEFCQSRMGKEYIVGGKLEGKDVGETSAPQRFGIRTVGDLKKLYYP